MVFVDYPGMRRGRWKVGRRRPWRQLRPVEPHHSNKETVLIKCLLIWSCIRNKEKKAKSQKNETMNRNQTVSASLPLLLLKNHFLSLLPWLLAIYTASVSVSLTVLSIPQEWGQTALVVLLVMVLLPGSLHLCVWPAAVGEHSRTVYAELCTAFLLLVCWIMQSVNYFHSVSSVQV